MLKYISVTMIFLRYFEHWSSNISPSQSFFITILNTAYLGSNDFFTRSSSWRWCSTFVFTFIKALFIASSRYCFHIRTSFFYSPIISLITFLKKITEETITFCLLVIYWRVRNTDENTAPYMIKYKPYTTRILPQSECIISGPGYVRPVFYHTITVEEI